MKKILTGLIAAGLTIGTVAAVSAYEPEPNLEQEQQKAPPAEVGPPQIVRGEDIEGRPVDLSSADVRMIINQVRETLGPEAARQAQQQLQPTLDKAIAEGR